MRLIHWAFSCSQQFGILCDSVPLDFRFVFTCKTVLISGSVRRCSHILSGSIWPTLQSPHTRRSFGSRSISLSAVWLSAPTDCRRAECARIQFASIRLSQWNRLQAIVRIANFAMIACDEQLFSTSCGATTALIEPLYVKFKHTTLEVSMPRNFEKRPFRVSSYHSHREISLCCHYDRSICQSPGVMLRSIRSVVSAQRYRLGGIGSVISAVCDPM